MSKLYFTYSAMNAGKSAILLQAAHNYREQGMNVMLWTSGHYGAAPDAQSGSIESRIGLDELNVPVLCYGLRTDFQGELFEGSAALLAIADDLREARTICHCGKKAVMTARLDETGKALTSGDQVSVGKEVYVSLCRYHWKEALGR